MRLKRALVFDDNLIGRRLLTEILQEKQFKVNAFSSPTDFPPVKEIVKCPLLHSVYDILITDNKMPNMTGLELLELQQHKGCKIPDHHKAIISGSWTKKDLERTKQLGCKVFHKPCPIDQIINWLEKQLRSIIENQR